MPRKKSGTPGAPKERRVVRSTAGDRPITTPPGTGGTLQDIVARTNPDSETSAFSPRDRQRLIDEAVASAAARPDVPFIDPGALIGVDDETTEEHEVIALDEAPDGMKPSVEFRVPAASDAPVVPEEPAYIPQPKEVVQAAAMQNDRVAMYDLENGYALGPKPLGAPNPDESVHSDADFAAELAAVSDDGATVPVPSHVEPDTGPRVPKAPSVPDAGVAEKAGALEGILGPAQRARHGLDAVAATTNRRGNKWGRWVVAAAAVGAVVAAFFFGEGRKSQPDAELSVPDVASQIDPGLVTTMAEDPVPQPPQAPEKSATEHVHMPIDSGVSQAMLKIGVDREHMMRALDLPVTIGGATQTFGDTFVIAAPGVIQLDVERDGSNVIGASFVDRDGHTLTSAELAKHVVFASVPQKEISKAPAHSAPDLSVAAAAIIDIGDDSALQAALDGVVPSYDRAPLDGERPGSLHVLEDAVAPIDSANQDGMESTISTGEPAAVSLEQLRETQRREIERLAEELVTERIAPPSIAADEPTDRVVTPDTATELRISPDAPTENVFEEYNDQMLALGRLFEAEKHHRMTLASGHVELRKRGKEYHVRYAGRGDFDELTPELYATLAPIMHLDFHNPMSAVPVTLEEYASALPDGHPMKERLRKNLKEQLAKAAELGYQNTIAEQQLETLEGRSATETSAPITEEPE